MKLSVMKLSLRHGLYDMYIYPGNPIVSEDIWTRAFLNCLPRSWQNWVQLIPFVVFSVNSSVDLFIFRKKRIAKSSAIVRYFSFEQLLTQFRSLSTSPLRLPSCQASMSKLILLKSKFECFLTSFY